MQTDQVAHLQARGQSSETWDPHWVGPTAQTTAVQPIILSPEFHRLMARLPPALRQSFSMEQMIGLSNAAIPTKSNHLIDYRVSFKFLRQRYYIVLLFGRERRSMQRLISESQLIASRVRLIYYFMSISAALGLTTVAIIGLYIFKALLGIDVFDGHSVMHDYVIGSGTPDTPLQFTAPAE